METDFYKQVIEDRYAKFLDSWESPSMILSEGVQILKEAQELGYRLTYVRDHYDHNLTFYAGHVVAERIED